MHKYGGTSLASAKLIKHAAERICECVRNHHSVVVVVSAMGDSTDKLWALARDVNVSPPAQELDVLLSTGEQISAALLSMALEAKHISARSYTGWQIPIQTNGQHMNARINSIETAKLRSCVDSNVVAIVAGFQGIDQHGNINTLGRGGSDTSAVALAVALKANECRIYTDVKGVYTADPRFVKNARVLEHICVEEMLELAGQGAKVLHPRAVEIAGRYQMPVRVLSHTDEVAKGTLLTYNIGTDNRSVFGVTGEDSLVARNTNNKLIEVKAYMETSLVSGISYDNDEGKIDVTGIPNIPGVAARILGTVARANIDVDMIVQSTGKDGTTNLSFTVNRSTIDDARNLVKETVSDTNTCEVRTDDRIAKVSVVGMGMRGHAGVASKMFDALAKQKINIELISTSEIKVAVVIAKKHLKMALNTLHNTFGLGQAVS